MKKVLLISCCFLHLFVKAQFENFKAPLQTVTRTEKYVSFNPFALLEPQIAIGAGFGNRFSKRSEYFIELSYLGKNPVYNYLRAFHGTRGIFQYRYHILQQRKPLINLRPRYRLRRVKIDPFIGAEFRMKYFSFTDEHAIVNAAINDTVSNFIYKANATVVAGAIISGATYNVGKNDKWKIEVSAGIGGRIKTVNLKNMPVGYQVLKIYRTDLGAPEISDAIGLPYFPFAIRLRYSIH